MKTTARRTTSASSINSFAIGSAKAMIAVPKSTITTIARPIARQPLRSAATGSPAPRFWPTRVEAAIEKPKPTRNENDRIWTPIW